MGRNKGGGGRSYNSPVIYEIPTVPSASASAQPLVLDIEVDASPLSIFVADDESGKSASHGAVLQSEGGVCEDNTQIELWLEALRQFLKDIKQQGAMFCHLHDVNDEVLAQLSQSIISLLAIDRVHLSFSQLASVYQRVQQIVLRYVDPE